MSSPSNARVVTSSSRVNARATKRDVAASRSKVLGASSVSNSSRSVAGVGGAASNSRSARVFLDGEDVTPQSLLVSRIKPSTPGGAHVHGQRGAKGGKVRAGNRSKGSNATLAGHSSAVAGASVIFSSTSAASTDNDSDGEASSSNNLVNSGGSTQRAKPSPPTKGKESKPSTAAAAATAALPSQPAAPSNQEDDDNQQDGESLDSSALKPGAVGFDDDGGGNIEAAGDVSAVDGKVSGIPAVSSAMAAVLLDGRTRRRPLAVTLEETPTAIILELRSVCVAQDAPTHGSITARNKRYVELCAQKKGSDKYQDGRSQTLQLAQKAKEVMTAPPATRDAATTATNWDIFDCARLEEEASNIRADDSGVDGPGVVSTATATTSAGTSTSDGGLSTEPSQQQEQRSNRAVATAGTDEYGDVQLKHQVEEIVGATLASPGCVLDVDGDIVEDLRARQHQASRTRRTRAAGAPGNSNSSNHVSRSRTGAGGSTAHTMDAGRSSANVNASSASAASPSQSGANVSFGTSQDQAASRDDGASSSSAVATSSAQIPAHSQSQALSGGSSDGRQQPNAYARANTNVDIGEIIARQRTAKVLASASLLRTANILERAVQQNVYHQQHVRYRDLPTLSPEDGDNGSANSIGSGPRRVGSVRDVGLASSSTVGGGVSMPSVVIPAFSAGFPTSGSLLLADSSTSAGSARGQTVSKAGPVLERLWAFRCELAEGRTVSCLAWNSVNDDLLAVSYARSGLKLASDASTKPDATSLTANTGLGGAVSGASSTSALSAGSSSDGSSPVSEGLVLFWSLKNPEYPERIYSFPVGVTSIDFSRGHPYLLAVGFADGVVAIYDTRRDDSSVSSYTPSTPGDKSQRPSTTSPTSPATQAHLHVPVPVATSELSAGKHLEAVWQIRWLSKGLDRAENVVSISSDGRVTEWSLAKGLSFSDLMTLKRVTNPLLGRTAASDTMDGSDGVLSRQASGQCIDFCPTDPSVYYVGTEDGLIHKCSASYNEQYLQTYAGHAGPVYQLAVSPFCPDLLLSCSGDWTIKLWHERESLDLLSFRSVDLQHSVLGISWSPGDAAVFAAVAEDGRVEIWDLIESILDPVVTHFPKKYVMAPVATPVGDNLIPGAGIAGNDDEDLLGGMTAGRSATTGEDADGNPVVTNTPAVKMEKREVALESTTVAFAPVAPVLVVGDSTGDVTVYRIPVTRGRWVQQLGGSGAGCRGGGNSAEEQVAQLLHAIRPNSNAQ